MSKLRAKFLLFILGIIILILVSALSISLVTRFVAAFQEGADPASIFHGHQLILPDINQARWLPTIGYEGMMPQRPQQEEIIAAYWQAWEAIGRAYETGNTSDLATYWSGDAFKHALSTVSESNDTVQTHSNHKLRLTFFSDDGSVVRFEDESFKLMQTVGSQNISLTASASVVMTLDNSFWRIRVLSVSYH